MKFTLLYPLWSLLLLGGATACSKTDPTPKIDSTSQALFVRATKDGTLWNLPGTGRYNKTSKQFYVFGKAGDAAKAEGFNLVFSLPASPQLAPVQPLPASWVELIGGDVETNRYETADAASLPGIEVTRIDTVAKIVEGRFNAILVRDKHYTSQTESMRFTNGLFLVHYTVEP
jgi:hypothetical protein